MNTASIALFTRDASLSPLLQQKARQYDFPVAEHEQGYDYLLLYQASPSEPGYTTSLRSLAVSGQNDISIDFSSGKTAHRRQYGGGRRQPLARAIGLRPSFNPVVIDCTAGLGQDSFVLASLGCRVIMLERHAVAYELLLNALQRAAAEPGVAEIIERMQLVLTDTRSYLQQSPIEAHCIYLDPMYPKRSKSALVKKEMQSFQQIIGADEDAASMLQLALDSGIARVVVKRPAQAPALGGLMPQTRVNSKKTRYDIYFPTTTQ